MRLASAGRSIWRFLVKSFHVCQSNRFKRSGVLTSDSRSGDSRSSKAMGLSKTRSGLVMRILRLPEPPLPCIRSIIENAWICSGSCCSTIATISRDCRSQSRVENESEKSTSGCSRSCSHWVRPGSNVKTNPPYSVEAFLFLRGIFLLGIFFLGIALSLSPFPDVSSLSSASKDRDSARPAIEWRGCYDPLLLLPGLRSRQRIHCLPTP